MGKMVHPTRVELVTSAFGGQRSVLTEQTGGYYLTIQVTDSSRLIHIFYLKPYNGLKAISSSNWTKTVPRNVCD